MALKGRRTPTNCKVASHVATQVPQTGTEDGTAPGFTGVVACLQRDPLLMVTVEAPLEPMQPEILAKPAIATMCTSCIIQDETTGVTYMDMVTTSVGRVALRSSCLVSYSSRPTIEAITYLSQERKSDNCL